ncbi:MAG: hypothetical protein GF320_22405 [Armatimonadia bacterium]|nr:hypothetical protein [Armatimonadia bacterium]
MNSLLLVMALSFGQAPAADLASLLPLEEGQVYSYWYEWGPLRDHVQMRVISVEGNEAVVRGFPSPDSLVAGEDAGQPATLRLDPPSGTVYLTQNGAERVLLTVPPGATPATVETWAGTHPAGVTVPLSVEAPLASAEAVLAAGEGLVALRFSTQEGSGEFVLVRSWVEEHQEPGDLEPFQAGSIYRYLREDLVGRMAVNCVVASADSLAGVPAFRVVGLPWFDQAAVRPLARRERVVAVDIAGRRWLESIGGEARSLFALEVTEVLEPVVVPAGTFDGCFRIQSGTPGMDALLHPDAGLVYWQFQTIAGPVTYELVRIEPMGAQPTSPEPPPLSTHQQVPPAGAGEAEDAAAETTVPDGTEDGTGTNVPIPAGPEGPGGEAEDTNIPIASVAAGGPVPLPAAAFGARGREIFAASPVAGEETLLEVPGNVELLAASPDGKRIAWVHSDGLTLSLGWARTANPSGSYQLIVDSIAEGDLDHLTWSPDGARLAFTRAYSVTVFDVQTGEQQIIGEGTRPLWLAPEVLVYESGSRPTDQEVGIVRAKLDGDLDMLVPWGFDAAAARGGATLAYAYPREDDDPRLYVRGVGKESQVLGSTRFDRDPVLSPDGVLMAYVRYNMDDPQGSYSLRLFNRSTEEHHELLTGVEAWPQARFSPEGALLCTVTSEDAVGHYACANPETGRMAPLDMYTGQVARIVVPYGAAARRP